ncbi:MAG: MiaB/RimO family radical SAM methylthiotransferase, partial [Oscillospiraceae bacterium]|nr:MiaB/RimO family radical SAM methylthiotransferase [Oscillospiraceae bacterium]
RIAEGCSNRCAYCVIPSLRGKYRSRPMEEILQEARELAESGVKECIVIAQDITRYGVDLYGEKRLPALLNALCDLDFQWIRLHYLYPDAITDELLDTIAAQPKICHYLDIPIQHCNDAVLHAMRRRETKAGLLDLFARIRRRIPDIVLRTSIITGLPFEDEAAFDELCAFLRQVRIQRAGAFPFSPEEGTPAAEMPNRVDGDEAARRAELVMDVQSDVMDDFNESRLGTVVTVLCDGWDEEAQSFVGRSYAESPGIDGVIYFDAPDAHPGDMLSVRITGVMDGDLTGQAEA